MREWDEEKKFVLTLFERRTLQCSEFISVRKTGWFAMNEDWKWNNSQSQWVNCFSIHGWCVWCIIFYGQQNSMAMNYLTIYTLCTAKKFAWKAWNNIYTQKNPNASVPNRRNLIVIHLSSKFASTDTCSFNTYFWFVCRIIWFRITPIRYDIHVHIPRQPHSHDIFVSILFPFHFYHIELIENHQNQMAACWLKSGFLAVGDNALQRYFSSIEVDWIELLTIFHQIAFAFCVSIWCIRICTLRTMLAMFEFFFVEFDDKWMKSVTAHRNREKHVLMATFICSN